MRAPLITDFLHVKSQARRMNCTFSLTVACRPALEKKTTALLKEALNEIADLEAELSEYRETSPVYQLNRAPIGKKIKFTASSMDLLKCSASLEKMTKMAFRPSAKSPGPSQALDRWVAWDETERTVWRVNPEAHIGFGAIGKGYALDRIRLRLQENGYEDFHLSAGGSSHIICGFARPAQVLSEAIPWDYHWTWKAKQGDGYEVMTYPHWTGALVSLGISGEAEQGGHIVMDAKAEEKTAAVLVCHPSAAVADALSTAYFALGYKGLKQNEKDEEPVSFGMSYLGWAMVQDGEMPLFRWNEIFADFFGPADGSAQLIPAGPLLGGRE